MAWIPQFRISCAFINVYIKFPHKIWEKGFNALKRKKMLKISGPDNLSGLFLF
jgi:hypothetical protein